MLKMNSHFVCVCVCMMNFRCNENTRSQAYESALPPICPAFVPRCLLCGCCMSLSELQNTLFFFFSSFIFKYCIHHNYFQTLDFFL